MIDIKAEAEKISGGAIYSGAPTSRQNLAAEIENLCTRYADEAREAAAKVCQKVSDENREKSERERKRENWSLHEGLLSRCEGALQCATAIRSSKEEKG